MPSMHSDQHPEPDPRHADSTHLPSNPPPDDRQHTPSDVFSPPNGTPSNFEPLITPTAQASPDEPTITRKVLPGRRSLIDYEIQRSSSGELLVSARVTPHNHFDLAGSHYVLFPHPKTETLNKLHQLLQQTLTAGLSADDILTQLIAVTRPNDPARWTSSSEISFWAKRDMEAMSTALPPFEEFAEQTTPITPRYMAAHRGNGSYEVCMCSLHPDDNTVQTLLLKSDSDEPPQEAERFAVRIAAPPAAEAPPRTERTTKLKPLAESIQRHFSKFGLAATRDYLKELSAPSRHTVTLAHLPLSKDARLQRAQLDPSSLTFQHTYPSGAALALECSSSVATLVLQASTHPLSSAYTMIFDRRLVPLNPWQWANHLREVCIAAKHLAVDSDAVQIQAIAQLQSLSSTTQFIHQGLENLLGPTSSADLLQRARETSINIRPNYPSSARDIQRLCEGIESVAMSVAVKPLSQTILQNYHSLVIRLARSGSVSFTANNDLGNQLSGTLSAQTMSKFGGPARIMEYFVKALDSQERRESRYPFEQSMERLCALDEENSHITREGTASYLALPPLHDKASQRAFSIAAGLARLICHQASGHGVHHVAWVGPGEAEIHSLYPAAPYALLLTISNSAITRFVFRRQQNSSAAQRQARVDEYQFNTALELMIAVGEVQKVNTPSLEKLKLLLLDFSLYGIRSSTPITKRLDLEDTMIFQSLSKGL